MSDKPKKYLPVILAVIVILLAWQLISAAIGYKEIFPDVFSLFRQIFNLLSKGEFYISLGMTIFRGMSGFVVSLLLAFILSIYAIKSDFGKSFLHPFIVLFRSVPVISLVLIALVWFSPEQLPVFIAVVTMFPVIYQNMVNGLELTDKKLIEMAKVFGKSAIQRFFSLYLPTAKPVIFGGISSAMGFGWRAVIIGEALSQPSHGIGSDLKSAQVYINISELIALTAIAIIISYLFDFVFKKMAGVCYYQIISKLSVKKHKKPDIIPADLTRSINLKEVWLRLGEHEIFRDFSFNPDSNKLWCLKAPSGFGKTTLLRLIAGLQKADKGDIQFKNIHTFGYAFQDNRLIPWLTVTENLEYVIPAYKSAEKENTHLIDKYLSEAELSDHKNKYPHELSGGQQQRVNLIRALLSFGDVVLLDEPLNGLDERIKLKMIDMTEQYYTGYKPLIIWATHEKIQMKNVVLTEKELV